MARPEKRTVDYFSHDANASEKRTLSILFNNFQHEGISCWWQLLERVSSAENHVIYLRNPEDREFLAAKLRLTPERLTEILNKMATLDAIDRDLYERGVIWCQNLVDRLADVYSTRRMGLPSKPELINQETELINQETELIPPINTQTKLNNTKLNNTKLKITVPAYLDEALWNDFIDMRKKIKRPATDRAKELLIKDIEKLKTAGDDPNDVLRQSIKNCWQGLFPLKDGGNGRYKGNPSQKPSGALADIE